MNYRQHLPGSAARPRTSARDRIVARARAYFFAHGFRAVTMDDLAGELGMSKRTLYAHFRSKVALLEAVIADKFDGLNAALDRLDHRPEHFAAALRELLTCLYRETDEVQPPFVRDVRREAPELFKFIQARRREVIQKHFGKMFAAGRRAGIIRADIPAAMMTEVLLAATDGIMNPPKMAELGLTPKAGFSAILSVVLEGVISEKGRKRM